MTSFVDDDGTKKCLCRFGFVVGNSTAVSVVDNCRRGERRQKRQAFVLW